MKGSGLSWVNTSSYGQGSLPVAPCCRRVSTGRQPPPLLSNSCAQHALPLQGRMPFQCSVGTVRFSVSFLCVDVCHRPKWRAGGCCVEVRKAGSECQADHTLSPPLPTIPTLQTSHSLLSSYMEPHGGAWEAAHRPRLSLFPGPSTAVKALSELALSEPCLN